ncbi:MAG: hypothetical protein FWE21_05275, partial [Defluviitaleaceae bacterium]|nr:hypothetical protein [Defluviitaleaceae bacterium]
MKTKKPLNKLRRLHPFSISQLSASSLKRLLALILVVTMITPSMAFASYAVDTENPWFNLPEIAPYNYLGYADFDPFFNYTSYHETRLMDLLSRMHDFDNFTAEEQALVSRHLGTYVNELAELCPMALEELLREQEAYWSTDWQMRETLAFFELLNSGVGFGALDEYNRNMIYRRLDIAYEAISVTAALFSLMESDGFSLGDSIELMRIMSTGLFNYPEAQTIFETIPDSRERTMELARFEHFAKRFDIVEQVSEMRLVNAPFVNSHFFATYVSQSEIKDDANGENGEATFNTRMSRVLPNISAFLTTRSMDDDYSFIETAQQGVGGIYIPLRLQIPLQQEAEGVQVNPPTSGQPDKPNQPSEDGRDEEYPKYPEGDRGIADEDNNVYEYDKDDKDDEDNNEYDKDDEHKHNDEEDKKYPECPDFPNSDNANTNTEEENNNPSPPTTGNNPPLNPEQGQGNPESGQTPTSPVMPVAQYTQVQLGLENALQSRHWDNLEHMTDDDWAILQSISRAFTSEVAFGVARELFLSGRATAEIRETFALGAALQVEP